MVFYKYAGDSGLRILEDLRLKITPPNEFNDPFEVTPHSIFERTIPELLKEVQTNPGKYRAIYDEMNRDGAYNETFEKFMAGLPQAIPRYFDKYRQKSKAEFAKRDAKTLDNVSQQIAILCLSKPANSIPMWSYYADHHRGIAFGFEMKYIGGALPCKSGFVKYSKKRVPVNQHLQPKSGPWRQQGFDMFFTKNREWKHEQEYRSIFPLSELISIDNNDGSGKHCFLDLSPKSIKEIIFGCRVNEELEKKICFELGRRKRTFGHIQLFRCERHKSRFELKIMPTVCK